MTPGGRPARWFTALGVAAALACGRVEAPPVAAGVVDSVFPIAEEVRRFAATLDSVPVALYGAASSREELMQRFVDAVAARDTVALRRLVLQRDEFLGLYYPHSRHATPPYALPPALAWFRLEGPSAGGLARLLAWGSETVPGVTRLTCPAEPRVEGPNRIWEECTVRVRWPDERAEERRLFGAILERDGAWKFLTYANQL